MRIEKKKLIGTDGIRGVVGKDFTPQFITHVGNSVGRFIHDTINDDANHNGRYSVVIGKDTRVSGYMFESAIEVGLLAAGIDVKLTGPISTPGLAYLVMIEESDFGIVITASHNEYNYNGIKFFAKGGKKLDKEMELKLEEYIQSKEYKIVDSENIGKAYRVEDKKVNYFDFCKNSFDMNLNLNNVKLVIDTANGSNYQIANRIFRELGAEVISIFDTPDGLNINRNCGIMHPENIEKAVIEHKADYGVVFDGDGDRVAIIDKEGKYYDGDELLLAIILYRLAKGEKITKVVGTLMTNQALENKLKSIGIELIRVDVGDKYVLNRLVDNNLLLGAENSGHIIMLDKHCTGDGIIASLHILELIQYFGKSLKDILDGFKLYPQITTTINVEKYNETDWQQNKGILDEIEQIKHKVNGVGRFFVRNSGTSPSVKVTIELEDLELANKLIDTVVTKIKDFYLK